MDKLKCSPWPWTVTHEDKYPFNIVTTDANGDEVATDRLCGHSSRDKTIADAMSACHFKPEDRDRVRLANETAVANAVLRGVAPELLDALRECRDVLAMLTDPERIRESRVQVAWAQAVAAEAKARAAILKAAGGAQ